MKKIALIVLVLCTVSFIAEDAEACRFLDWLRDTRSRRVAYKPANTVTHTQIVSTPQVEDEKPEPPKKVAKAEEKKVEEKKVEEVAEVSDKPEPPEKIEKPVPTVDITPKQDSRFKLLPDENLTNSD